MRLGLGRLAAEAARQRRAPARHEALAVGMDQLRVGPKRAAAQRFCSVVAARAGSAGRERRALDAGRRRARRRAGPSAERGRLVGDAHLERPEARMRPDVPPDARVVGDHAERTRRSTKASHSAYEPKAGGAPRARQLREHLRARRQQPGRAPATNGEFADSASTTGSHGSTPRAAHSSRSARLDADVDVQAVHALAARRRSRRARRISR